MKNKWLSGLLGIAFVVTLLFPALGRADMETNTREQWSSIMQNVLPKKFCAKGGYFRSCFTPGEKECRRVTFGMTADCLARVKPQMPDVVGRDDAHIYGEMVGSCVGEAYAKAYARKRRPDVRCRDASAWE